MNSDFIHAEEVICIRCMENGLHEEVKLKYDNIHTYLGGSITFVGALPEIDVVALALEHKDGKEKNKSLLVLDFEDDVFGEVVLVKVVGKDAIPIDLSMSEITPILLRNRRKIE